MSFLDESLKYAKSTATKPHSFIDESTSFSKTGINPTAYAREAKAQTTVDPDLYTQLRTRGATSSQVNTLAPKPVSKAAVAYDVLEKADRASEKVIDVIGTPFALLAKGVSAFNRGIGATMTKIAPVGDERGKSFGELYEQDRGLSGRIADTLSMTTKELRSRSIGQDKTVNILGKDYSLDEVMPEVIGAVGEFAEAGIILGAVGKRIATKTGNKSVTSEQMIDLMTGRTPQGKPLAPEVAEMVRKELLKPDVAKPLIKEAVQKGVQFKTTGPASPARQLAGQLVGGSAEEPRTSVMVGGRDIKATTPFQAVTAPQGALAAPEAPVASKALAVAPERPMPVDAQGNVIPASPAEVAALTQEMRTPFQVLTRPVEPIASPALTEPTAPSAPVEATKPTKAALDINKTLVQKGIQELPPEELANYSPIKKDEQIQRVSELLASDLEGAKQMARGEIDVPNEVKSQVLFNAVKEYAKTNNDINLLMELAKSPIAEERSLAAQTLGSSGFNNGGTDPVATITELNKQLKEKKTKTVAKEVVVEKTKFKQAVKRARAPKQDWNSFIDEITC